jgi:AcrR family transcriptional regulator
MNPPKKQSTRTMILEQATQIASLEGLNGLTINNLAQALGMSKSGVFAHFGSKEELQIATLNAAWEIFSKCFAVTANTSALDQIKTLLENWMSYLEQDTFIGGCVFMAASTELDGQTGMVREHLFKLVFQAVEILMQRLQQAQENQSLNPAIPVQQMAFELHSFLLGANAGFQLTKDRTYFFIARNAIATHLQNWSI